MNLEQKIKEVENEITSIEEQMNVLSIQYDKDFAAQLQIHPFPEDVLYFKQNKDKIAENIAIFLCENSDPEEIYFYTEEIKLLFFAFEYSLLFYEDNIGIVENFKECISDDKAFFPVYIDAIALLDGEKLNRGIFTQRSKNGEWKLFLNHKIIDALKILKTI